MAEVYKAWDAWRNYHVAIKVMREDLAEDFEFLELFRREASALKALSHINIVRFYSFEREGRLAFIVMDFVEGSSLRGRIFDAEGQPLTLDDFASVMRQVCAALHYAHGENVLHRDIKPGNIMIRPNGQVLIADFGIAKAADAATATTVMPGTPAYMSPEQCRSELLDERTDVYSLGIMAYEMLAGRRPFRGQSTESGSGSTRERIRWEQINLPPPPLRQFNPAISVELEKMVLKALAKERDARWRTPLAFWQALQGTLQSLGIAAENVVIASPTLAPAKPVSAGAPLGDASPPVPLAGAAQPGARPPAAPPGAKVPSETWQTGEQGRDRGVLVLAGAVAVLAIVVAAVIFYAVMRDKEEIPTLVGLNLDRALGVLSETSFEAEVPDTMGLAPSAFRVVWQEPPPGARSSRGSRLQLDIEQRDITVTQTPTPSQTPTPPTGTMTSTATGTTTTTTATATGTGTPTGTASPTPTGTGSPTPTVSPTATQTPSPSPSPTTTHTPSPTPTATNPPPPRLAAKIAFAAKREDGKHDLYIMDPDGSNRQQLTSHSGTDTQPSWSPDGQYIVFHSDRYGNNDIFVTNRQGEGTYLAQLTSHGANDHDPSWSPNGQWIAFISERNGNRNVYVMNSDGSSVRQLTNVGAAERRPAWSPDSRYIIFESKRDGDTRIYIMDVNGGGQRPLSSGPGDDISPNWAPSVNQITFASHRDADFQVKRWPEIYVMNSGGGNQTRLTSNNADDDMPAWSPDGSWILFSSREHSCSGVQNDRQCDWDLYLIRPDGSNRQRLAATLDLSEVSATWWAP